MFSYFKLHRSYARRIEGADGEIKKMNYAMEYFRLKMGDAVAPKDSTSENDPALARLQGKYIQLKAVVNPSYHVALDKAYFNIIQETKVSVSPEVWEKLLLVGKTYNLSPKILRELTRLVRFDIRLVIDDSESMMIQDAIMDDYPCTRWNELRFRAKIMAEIATCLDADGINLYFMNTEPKIVRNVCTAEEVEQAFNRKPISITPIRATVEIAMTDEPGDKPLLIMLGTDGSPTDDIPPEYKDAPEGYVETPEGNLVKISDPKFAPDKRLERVLASRTPEHGVKVNREIHFGVMLINKGAEVAIWNGIDKRVPGLDVNRSFQEEKQEILQKTGKELKFEEYQAKVFLGSIKLEYDQLDESQRLMCGP